jgi:hypothetical protein
MGFHVGADVWFIAPTYPKAISAGPQFCLASTTAAAINNGSFNRYHKSLAANNRSEIEPAACV